MKQSQLMDKLRMITKKKINLVEKYPQRYFMRAFLASVLLTLGTTLSFLIAQTMSDLLSMLLPLNGQTQIVFYNVSKIIFALSFGWALVLILFMNTELFTANVMFFGSQLFYKEVKWKTALKVLTLCYFGNLVGAALTALFFVYSQTFTMEYVEFAAQVVFGKLAKEPVILVLQGIIANMVVNIAIVLSLQLKEDIAKVFAIIFTIFSFAYFGSEHLVANFVAFALVGSATGFAGMSGMAILMNFFFVTIGNMIGGGLVIGIVYAWLNKGDFEYKD